MGEFGFWSFYFSKRPRVVITLPLFLILIINPIYNGVLALLFYVDFLIGVGETNLLLWILLAFLSPVQLILYSMPFDISVLPLILLPVFWERFKIWGIAKVIMFPIVVGLATILSGISSALCLGFIEFIGTARISLWWGQVWGVFS